MLSYHHDLAAEKTVDGAGYSVFSEFHSNTLGSVAAVRLVPKSSRIKHSFKSTSYRRWCASLDGLISKIESQVESLVYRLKGLAMGIVRNIAAFIVGLVLGSIVNMTIITAVSPMFPMPEGTNPNDIDSIKANIHKFSIGSLMVPFFAHALGTLFGAFLTAAIAKSHKLPLALGIGFFFLLGGIAMIVMVGGPIWFMVLDLGVAYFPMAWLGFAAVNLLLNKPQK